MPDLSIVESHFVAACASSRAYSAAFKAACAEYGDHGPDVSGAGRAHFPADVKDRLRQLARDVSAHSDAAWSARPSRVRHATIRALGRKVAARDGSGYYGPQA